ncbi:YadA C-terminal domain-containing protein [Dyella telluris]|uniref:YadA C-terminal domain-containing protein n=1 Tax=Dyella telluris TaxID=2763498 RepID=A0A7G8Q0V4_9GAMM|nr:YadA C-terminal domain-containing protein [Dyella telluris]QNK00412.1 YadA C-terminal domain-containing protein [Dyella telluris]
MATALGENQQPGRQRHRGGGRRTPGHPHRIRPRHGRCTRARRCAGGDVFGGGRANYRGQTALGVGISRWSDNGRVNFNAGVSAAKNDSPVVRVGVGYVF